MHPDLLAAQKIAGIHFMGQPNMDFFKTAEGGSLLAMDAQPPLVTVSNAGIPAMFTTFVDPKNIEILVTPMKATEVVGEERKVGDWVTDTTAFITVENTGEVSSYGDYAQSGQAGVNVNYPQRQSYHYQVIKQLGEREIERAGLGKVNLESAKTRAAILTLNKFQNYSYFFGIEGLQNYGLLNDPNLLAAITPGIKAAGGTEWVNPTTGQPNATALEVIADIQAMYYHAQKQAPGLIELDTKFTLAMSPLAEVAMTFTNQFNNPVKALLKTIFPNMTMKTAPEYSTAAGEFVQLIADDIEGQRTAVTAFTEKLRAHPMIIELSSFKQKMSQGSWGTVIFRPIFIVGMLGV